MITLPKHKRGDTFAFYADITDDNGDAISGASSKFFCQIRNQQDKLIENLDITETETSGRYYFRAGDTQNWPDGTLYMDIEYRDNDVVTSSETCMFLIEKDVTYNA